MASRVAATIVLIAGIAVLVWVAVGNNADETITASPATGGAAADVRGDELADAVESEPPDAANETADDTTTGQAAVAPEPTATPTPSIEAPENFGPRMDLVEIDGWLNTDATSIDDFNGKVVLVEMWTFGCHNCKARIPFNQSYYEEFADENFEIVGVHAPEFSFEAEVPNIVEAMDRLGVTWPVALDTDKKNFRAWQPGSTNFWPRTYVIDQNGDIRYDHIGEGKYEELRETIRYLIENPPAPTPSP